MKRFELKTIMFLTLPALALMGLSFRDIVLPAKPHIEILENRVHRLKGKAIEHSVAIQSNPHPWWIWRGKSEVRIDGSRCYDFRGREITQWFSGDNNGRDLRKPTARFLYNIAPILRQTGPVTFRCWLSWKENNKRTSKSIEIVVDPQSLATPTAK